MEHLTEEQISELCNNSDSKNSELLDHIKSCTTCQLKYDQALSLHAQLKSLEFSRPSMRFAKNIIELLERNKELDLKGKTWTKVIFGGIIMATTLAIVLTILWFEESMSGIPDANQRIYEWSVIFMTVVVGAWAIYFLDNWLGRKQRHRIQKFQN